MLKILKQIMIGFKELQNSIPVFMGRCTTATIFTLSDEGLLDISRDICPQYIISDVKFPWLWIQSHSLERNIRCSS